MDALHVCLLVAVTWAIVGLAAQVLIARGGGRREFSRPAGRGVSGVLYNFTVAMLPGHKESTRLHPAEFVAGILLHLGVLGALVMVGVLAAGATSAVLVWLRMLAGLGAAAAIALLLRRLCSPLMRALSTPDDYLAVLATCGLLVLAALAAGNVLLAYTALFLVYLPLGKLRHAVFFFVARADYGRRLGYRGVYPPARVEAD